MSDKTQANNFYQNGYADGYRRGQMSKHNNQNDKDKIEHMYVHSHDYIPYVPITYYTAVIILLTMFIIFILIASHLDRRPVGYVTKYKGNCLLKMSTNFSAVDCVG
jgi:hypothetical protein